MRLAAPHRRTTAIAAGATACLLLTGTAAFAAPGGDGGSAEIQVDASCTSVDVLSTKAISNVVLQFADGSRLRFEDLPESGTGTFAGDGDDVIEVVWVKSGNNKSGDGPGYGERFDLDTSDCTEEPPATPEGEEEPQDTRTTTSDDEPEADPEPEAPTQDDPEPEVDAEGDDREDRPEGEDPEVGDEDDDTDEDGDDPAPADVLNAELERDPSTTATPTPDLAPRVLGVVLDREVSAAAGDGIRPAEALPNTGAPALALLTAALGSLGLGGAALRRRRTN